MSGRGAHLLDMLGKEKMGSSSLWQAGGGGGHKVHLEGEHWGGGGRGIKEGREGHSLIDPIRGEILSRFIVPWMEKKSRFGYS